MRTSTCDVIMVSLIGGVSIHSPSSVTQSHLGEGKQVAAADISNFVVKWSCDKDYGR